MVWRKSSEGANTKADFKCCMEHHQKKKKKKERERRVWDGLSKQRYRDKNERTWHGGKSRDILGTNTILHMKE